MGFTDLVTDAGVTVLNSWLTTRSYVAGYSPSQADVTTFKALRESPQPAKYPHAYRWYKHINSFQPEFSSLPGDPSKSYTAYGPEAVSVAVQEAPKAEADEDDLFASEEEEEDPEAARQREENLAAYKAKKAGKTKPAAKSIVTLEISPRNIKTDMDKLVAEVKKVKWNGAVWGGHKIVPIAYGLVNLQMIVVVEDELVDLEQLQEWIGPEQDDDEDDEEGDKENDKEDDEEDQEEDEEGGEEGDDAKAGEDDEAQEKAEKKNDQMPEGPNPFIGLTSNCRIFAMQKL